ncbi:uncharacterized protein ATNIH1004_005199 [Aspergillus tanneri]|uniref:Integral membrane bound transporter domain-containing protein n=1 Tax=Aspergillus tanneri TaxID=1220188 RepID=A0A5M9MQX8_9EURO|nr:uncharacterized protein ATNIH1004_005199 [Aspergillus tanneri]KAA8649298.1 hypothetical protein ATNIH1004_005199 [Aspergillus tanneri]
MVLTKEGAIQRGDISLTKVSQVLKMLLMGTSASVVVSFLVFPVSARKKLRSNVVALTRSMAIMQSMITESFVSRNERDLQGHKFIGASARQRKANSQLSKLLQETRLEHYVAGTEGEYLFEEKLVRWAQGITHDLAALHMSAHLAFEMLREPDYFHSRTDARENSADSATAEDTAGDEQIASSSFLATEIFDNFIRQIGPSMRSLVDTLTDVFNEVAFRLAPEYESSVNPRLPVVLSQSVDEYREAQAEAFALLHQNIRKRNLTVQEQECFQGVYASCAHYSFSLLQFSEQSKQLLVILEEFQTEIHRQPRRKSWNWVRRWLWGRGRRSNGDNATNCEDHMPRALYMSINGPESDPSRNSPIETNITRPMEMMELSSLENESRIQRMRDSASYRLWKVASFFGKDETKFAIKVGMGAALYASPSFLSLTRPFYLYWKGEWGLVSYMLVCSMTIGASNTIGFARFLGTCVGALFSIGVWYVAGANASALAFLGFLMANWTFYMSLLKGQGPLGRFIMLTYNLSVLYAYSLSQRTTDDDVDEGTSQNPDITKITLHRVGAVLSGCIWGIIITRGIWPISARKKLEATLRLVWLRLGRILQSDPLDKRITNPGVPMLYMTAQERLEMERLLSELEALRASARYEFELKRPFPDAAYCNIIQHTQAIVDILHALDLQLLSVTPVSEQEISILRYTMTDRQTLSGHITHLLEKMASSIKSDYPPIDVDISSMTHARGQLRAHIFLYRKEQEKSQPTIQEAYRLLYAYELVTSQVSNRIAQIVTEISQISFYRDEDVVS